MTSQKNDSEQNINNITQTQETNIKTDYPDVFFTNQKATQTNINTNNTYCNNQSTNILGLNGIASLIPKLFGGEKFDLGKLAGGNGVSNILSLLTNNKKTNNSSKNKMPAESDETNNIDLSAFIQVE